LVKKNRDEIIKQFQIQLSCLFCRHFKKCDIVQICKLQEKYRKVHTDFSKLICKDFDPKRYLDDIRIVTIFNTLYYIKDPNELLLCENCGSSNIVKNGTNKSGNIIYHCNNCNIYKTINLSKYTDKQKKIIIEIYNEYESLRLITKMFNISKSTLWDWIQKFDKNH
jgi:transposase-like protein